MEESHGGNGEGELGTLNGRRHYLDNGCCVEQTGNGTIQGDAD